MWEASEESSDCEIKLTESREDWHCFLVKKALNFLLPDLGRFVLSPEIS